MKTKDQIEFQIAELSNNTPLLTRVRKVNGGKFQIEVAEKIPEASTAQNDSSSALLTLMNESDDRFSQGTGARRAWLTVGSEELRKYMSIDVSKLEFIKDQDNSGNTVEVAWIGEEKPKINGRPVSVQVIESLTPQDAYQASNELRTCKKSNDGKILLKDGKLIFSKTKLGVTGQFEHTIITHDTRVSANEYNSSQIVPTQGLTTEPVEAPVKVEEKVEEQF